MSSSTSGLGWTAAILLLIGVGAGAVFFAKEAGRNRGRAEEARDRVSNLEDEAEKLVSERSRLQITVNEQRRLADDLAERLSRAEPGLEAARADLVRVRAERDEHLDRRLFLERRLTDTESALAEALSRAASLSGD